MIFFAQNASTSLVIVYLPYLDSYAWLYVVVGYIRICAHTCVNFVSILDFVVLRQNIKLPFILVMPKLNKYFWAFLEILTKPFYLWDTPGRPFFLTISKHKIFLCKWTNSLLEVASYILVFHHFSSFSFVVVLNHLCMPMCFCNVYAQVWLSYIRGTWFPYPPNFVPIVRICNVCQTWEVDFLLQSSVIVWNILFHWKLSLLI